jgi:hypothetical protein
MFHLKGEILIVGAVYDIHWKSRILQETLHNLLNLRNNVNEEKLFYQHCCCLSSAVYLSKHKDPR